MITNEIGINAGRIWNLLNEQGEHSVKDLKKKLKLSERDLNMAIGWLARENNIYQSEKDEVWVIRLKD
jgi:hypothetical protein